MIKLYIVVSIIILFIIIAVIYNNKKKYIEHLPLGRYYYNGIYFNDGIRSTRNMSYDLRGDIKPVYYNYPFFNSSIIAY